MWGIEPMEDNVTRDSGTGDSTNTLLFVNVKDVTTVLGDCNTDKLPDADFRHTSFVQRWYDRSYSILTEVLPIRRRSTGSSSDGMMYSVRSIDCVDRRHHVAIR